jgi:hypothetical protein
MFLNTVEENSEQQTTQSIDKKKTGSLQTLPSRGEIALSCLKQQKNYCFNSVVFKYSNV